MLHGITVESDLTSAISSTKAASVAWYGYQFLKTHQTHK